MSLADDRPLARQVARRVRAEHPGDAEKAAQLADDLADVGAERGDAEAARDCRLAAKMIRCGVW